MKIHTIKVKTPDQKFTYIIDTDEKDSSYTLLAMMEKLVDEGLKDITRIKITETKTL